MVAHMDFIENGIRGHCHHIFSGTLDGVDGHAPEKQPHEDNLGWDSDSPAGASSHGYGIFPSVSFGGETAHWAVFVDYFGIKIAFSWGATVIAAVVISFPLMYRSARGALEQVDENLVSAARTLGMGEGQIFLRVLCPNAVPGIVSGGVLAFARGLGEFGATAMIAGNIAGKTRTLPLAVYSEVAAGHMDEAGKYVLIIVVMAFFAVLLMNLAGNRTMRRDRSAKKTGKRPGMAAAARGKVLGGRVSGGMGEYNEGEQDD